MEQSANVASLAKCGNEANHEENDLSRDISTLCVRNTETKRTDYLIWDDYFMAVAFVSAMRSKDPSSQVGACIINSDKKIVGIGYNGMPSGCSDDELPWNKTSTDPLETKYMYVCHAEMNAIMNRNCSDLAGCCMYVALFPCNECAKLIIQARIREIIFLSDKHHDKVETVASRRILDMAGVLYRQYYPSKRRIVLNPQEDSKTSEPNGDVQSSERDINTKRKDYLSWREYFMAIAQLSTLRSKDPSTQVGACIVNSKMRIVGIGYNGMPVGCSDDELPWGKSSTNRLETKYMYVCHAGVNAVMNKNTFDVSDCTMYMTLFPCNECTKVIIQSGIRRIVYASDKYREENFTRASKRMLDLSGVQYSAYNSVQKKIVIDFKAIDPDIHFKDDHQDHHHTTRNIGKTYDGLLIFS